MRTSSRKIALTLVIAIILQLVMQVGMVFGATPTVTVSSASNISQTSATLNGAITANGGELITEYGFCWGTYSGNPQNKELLGTSNYKGTISKTITGLTPGTTYYFYCYAKNNSGKNSSTVYSFTTSAPVVSKPSVTVYSATNISQTSATLNGNISNNGNGSLNDYGFCWGTNSGNPENKVQLGTSDKTGNISTNITGLAPGTTYYFYIYARNSADKGTSQVISFTTSAPVVSKPSVTVYSATNISQTSATLNGNISNNGNGSLNDYGFCWGTNSGNPENKVQLGTSDKTGNISTNITGLAPGTTYYFYIYARNSADKGTSQVISFTTSAPVVSKPSVTVYSATNISQTSATLNGNISNNGNGSLNDYGFCWGTNSGNPENKVQLGTSDKIGDISTNITGLAPGTTYYFYIYARNSADKGTSQVISFTTSAPVVSKPSVTVYSATNISQTSATLNGNISNNGNGSLNDYGFCWGTNSGNPENKVQLGTSDKIGDISTNITGLAPDTTYYFYIYARNSADKGTSQVISFTTSAPVVSKPSVTVYSATNISQTSATLNGNISNNGNGSLNDYGFCWGTNSGNPENKVQLGTSDKIGDISTNITGLAPDTTYYFYIYARNSADKGTSQVISFTTSAPVVSKPSVTVYSATNISQTSATLNGNISNNGNGSLNDYGFCWGTNSGNPENKVQLGTSDKTGDISTNITGLAPDTTYYFYIYARNSADKGTSQVVSFTTESKKESTPEIVTPESEITVEAPFVTVYDAENITGTSAVLNGCIDYNGGSPILEYGFCWGTSSGNPQNKVILGQKDKEGDVHKTITDLKPETTYYFYVYAKNIKDTSRSNLYSFTTSSQAPSIKIYNAEKITESSATLKGVVEYNGSTSIQECGFYWGTNSEDPQDKQVVGCECGSSNIEMRLNGLKSASKYYYYIYAKTLEGITKSDIYSFKTSAPTSTPTPTPATYTPTINISNASNIGLNSATLNGEITANGGAEIYEYGFCWGVNAGNPENKEVISYSNYKGTISKNISGLSAGKTYYFYVFAKNSAGTARSRVYSFTTSAPTPTPTIKPTVIEEIPIQMPGALPQIPTKSETVKETTTVPINDPIKSTPIPTITPVEPKNIPDVKIILQLANPKAIVKDNVKFIDSDNPVVVPYIKIDRTMVPLRFIADSIGLNTSFKNGIAFISKDDKTIGIKANDAYIYNIAGTKTNQKLRAVPEITNGRIFVSGKDIVEFAGLDIFSYSYFVVVSNTIFRPSDLEQNQWKLALGIETAPVSGNEQNKNTLADVAIGNLDTPNTKLENTLTPSDVTEPKVQLENVQKPEHKVVFLLDSPYGLVNSTVKAIDEKNEDDIYPYVYFGRTMLPFKYLAESIGGKANWDSKTGMVTVTVNADTIGFKAGDLNIYDKFGKETGKKLLVPPVIKEGRTFGPARELVEHFGYNIVPYKDFVSIGHNLEKSVPDELIKQWRFKLTRLVLLHDSPCYLSNRSKQWIDDTCKLKTIFKDGATYVPVVDFAKLLGSTFYNGEITTPLGIETISMDGSFIEGDKTYVSINAFSKAFGRIASSNEKIIIFSKNSWKPSSEAIVEYKNMLCDHEWELTDDWTGHKCSKCDLVEKHAFNESNPICSKCGFTYYKIEGSNSKIGNTIVYNADARDLILAQRMYVAIGGKIYKKLYCSDGMIHDFLINTEYKFDDGVYIAGTTKNTDGTNPLYKNSSSGNKASWIIPENISQLEQSCNYRIFALRQIRELAENYNGYHDKNKDMPTIVAEIDKKIIAYTQAKIGKFQSEEDKASYTNDLTRIAEQKNNINNPTWVKELKKKLNILGFELDILNANYDIETILAVAGVQLSIWSESENPDVFRKASWNNGDRLQGYVDTFTGEVIDDSIKQQEELKEYLKQQAEEQKEQEEFEAKKALNLKIAKQISYQNTIIITTDKAYDKNMITDDEMKKIKEDATRIINNCNNRQLPVFDKEDVFFDSSYEDVLSAQELLVDIYNYIVRLDHCESMNQALQSEYLLRLIENIKQDGIYDDNLFSTILDLQLKSKHLRPEINVNGRIDKETKKLLNDLKSGTVLPFFSNLSFVMKQATKKYTASSQKIIDNRLTDDTDILIGTFAVNVQDVFLNTIVDMTSTLIDPQKKVDDFSKFVSNGITSTADFIKLMTTSDPNMIKIRDDANKELFKIMENSTNEFMNLSALEKNKVIVSISGQLIGMIWSDKLTDKINNKVLPLNKVGNVAIKALSKFKSFMNSTARLTVAEIKSQIKSIRKINFKIYDVELVEGGAKFPIKVNDDIPEYQRDNFIKAADEIVSDGAKVEKTANNVATSLEAFDEALNLWKKSLCSTDELYKYIKTIDSESAELFLKERKWVSNIQVPKNSSTLRANGTINWDKAPKGGYVLDGSGNPMKDKYVPKIGETIDRYGPPDGRYTSPIVDKIPYNYDQRALPYIEDVTQYHKYEVTGDMSKLQEYVANCTDEKLKLQIDAYITKYYDGNYSKALPYKGEIAGIDGWGSGGGIQYELPLPVEWLKNIGLLKEIK